MHGSNYIQSIINYKHINRKADETFSNFIYSLPSSKMKISDAHNIVQTYTENRKFQV